jgi:hypothetical protein
MVHPSGHEPWYAVGWISALVVAPLIVGVALGLFLNAHAALTAVAIYFVGLLLWTALRAMGGRSDSTRSAQLVLALGVVTAIVADNTAIALTLCMLGLSGVMLAIARGSPAAATIMDATALDDR